MATPAQSSTRRRVWGSNEGKPPLQTPRVPGRGDSPLDRLVDDFYEQVKGAWEERFERTYGFWRGFVDGVVLAFQACGDFAGGFARDFFDGCRGGGPGVCCSRWGGVW